MPKDGSKEVKAYIEALPPFQQRILARVRKTIRKAVPRASERISYGIPSFHFHGPILYYGAFKAHYSVFGGGPVEALRKAFRKELAPYAGAKGTIRFPYGKPVPTTLIHAIARHRARQNLKPPAPRAKRG